MAQPAVPGPRLAWRCLLASARTLRSTETVEGKNIGASAPLRGSFFVFFVGLFVFFMFFVFVIIIFLGFGVFFVFWCFLLFLISFLDSSRFFCVDCINFRRKILILDDFWAVLFSRLLFIYIFF